MLTSCAGPLLGPPGGAALFDTLLPALLVELGRCRRYGGARRTAPAPRHPARWGSIGPLVVTARGRTDDALLLDARAFGAPRPRGVQAGLGGDTSTTAQYGGMPFAFDDDLLYLGPFALPRTRLSLQPHGSGRQRAQQRSRPVTSVTTRAATGGHDRGRR